MRSGRALRLAIVAFVGLGTSACGVLGSLPIPTPTPAPPPLPETAFPSAPGESPEAIRDAAVADGWRVVRVVDAGIGFYVPDDWYVDVITDLGLGDFEELPPEAEGRDDAASAAGEAKDDDDQLMVYGQSGEFATGGHDDVVLHFSSWQFVGTHTLDDLVQILAEDRLEETEIADRATVETGAGEAERLHYWWADSGDVYSTVEFVFFALDGQAYTLSMLTAEPIADQMWPIFSRIGASLHPLD